MHFFVIASKAKFYVPLFKFQVEIFLFLKIEKEFFKDRNYFTLLAALPVLNFRGLGNGLSALLAKRISCNAGVAKLRPAGQIRPAKTSYPARVTLFIIAIQMYSAVFP